MNFTKKTDAGFVSGGSAICDNPKCRAGFKDWKKWKQPTKAEFPESNVTAEFNSAAGQVVITQKNRLPAGFKETGREAILNI